MIQYSSINDAWGNKEMFRNKKPSLLPKINYDTPNLTPILTPTSTPTPTPIPIQNKSVEKMTNKKCDNFEHMMNCPKCFNKLREKFSQSAVNKYKVNIFGLKINITKEILQAVFFFLILCIILLLVSSFNTSTESTAIKYYILPNNFNQMYHN